MDHLTELINRPLVTTKVLNEVGAERERQEIIHPQNRYHTLDRWGIILGEEFGEACKEILERQWLKAREELIQVAAVAVAIVEKLDRDQATCTRTVETETGEQTIDEELSAQGIRN